MHPPVRLRMPGGLLLAAPLGAAQVAKAEPDGYTLLLHHIGMATSATLYRNLPYDLASAFEPVSLLVQGPNVLVVHPSVPARTVAVLVQPQSR